MPPLREPGEPPRRAGDGARIRARVPRPFWAAWSVRRQTSRHQATRRYGGSPHTKGHLMAGSLHRSRSQGLHLIAGAAVGVLALGASSNGAPPRVINLADVVPGSAAG